MFQKRISVIALGALAIAFTAAPALAQDASRSVENGGIHVPGWMGKIDAREASNGSTLEDASLAMSGGSMHVTTGPAVVYWKPDNAATGDYTVSATFHEAEYMNLNNHPHPYGIVIAGNNMGSDDQTYLYCAAYGSGKFIVRGFGPDAFQMNGRGEETSAVNSAAGQGEPVTQEISMSVRGGNVECAINGSTVASYPRSEVVTSGKLGSTNGNWGVRFGHNTEATISDLKITRH